MPNLRKKKDWASGNLMNEYDARLHMSYTMPHFNVLKCLVILRLNSKNTGLAARFSS
jgi:hypothetical protein